MAFDEREREEQSVEAALAKFSDEYGATAHDLAWNILGTIKGGRTVLPTLLRLELQRRIQRLWYDSYHQGFRWRLARADATVINCRWATRSEQAKNRRPKGD